MFILQKTCHIISIKYFTMLYGPIFTTQKSDIIIGMCNILTFSVLLICAFKFFILINNP